MIPTWPHAFGLTLCAGALLACAALPVGARADDAPVKLACNDFPPLKIAHPDASGLPGSDVEILHEIFKRAGIGLAIEYLPWKRAFVEAQRGEVDGLCSCSYAADREPYFFYSTEIGRTSVGLFTLAARILPKIDSLEALKAEVGSLTRVGVVGGYNLEADLANYRINRNSVVNDKTTLDMLVKGRFDFLYSYRAPVEYIHKTRSTAFEIKFTELGSSPYFVCLSKTVERNAGILEKLNTAIVAMSSSGAIDRILDKYR